jgi:hypothetical protein
MMLNLNLYDALMMSKILVRLVYSKHLTQKDAGRKIQPGRGFLASNPR